MKVALYALVAAAILVGVFSRSRLWARICATIVLVCITTFVGLMVEAAPRLAEEKYGRSGTDEIARAWQDGASKTALVIEQMFGVGALAILGLGLLAVIPLKGRAKS
jgi:TRAP-type C4-dicarboxylate transport system permease small subunit